MTGSLLVYLDIAIGFVLVMLLASSLVTVVSQWLLNIGDARARVLRSGLESLLAQLDRSLERHAGAIAQAVLSHPQVAARNWWGGKAAGTVVQRESLVRVLLDLAADERAGLGEGAAAALRAALGFAENDAAIPGSLRDAVLRRVLRLEAANPALARHVVHTRAIMETLQGRLVTGIMSSFDEASARMTQLFAQRARLVTVALSVIVAVSLPIDSFDLLRRLAKDEALRTRLLEAATRLEAVPTPETGATVQGLRRDLEALAIVSVRGPQVLFDDEGGHWRLWTALPGLLLTASLLGLGAPFWFEALKHLLKLRPVLAQREEAERRERLDRQRDGAG